MDMKWVGLLVGLVTLLLNISLFVGACLIVKWIFF